MRRTAFQGNISNYNQWCSTWGKYFSRNLCYMIDLERTIHGSDPEMDALYSDIMTKVVPWLLRPLESGGNKIILVLLHGDMCHGNVSVDNESDEPILYDTGSFFEHNEYEVSSGARLGIDSTKLICVPTTSSWPVSEQAEDHDDRNAL